MFLHTGINAARYSPQRQIQESFSILSSSPVRPTTLTKGFKQIQIQKVQWVFKHTDIGLLADTLQQA